LRSRAVLQTEILTLRHQLLIFERSRRGHNLRLRWTDRALWVWLSRLGRLAIGAADGQAGDCHRVASPGISALWEMEKSAWRWPPGGISGSSQSHPSNERRQPALGASHSWGIAEDGNRSVSSDRGQIHGPPPETSLPDMADFPQESHQGLGFHRFLVVPTVTFQLLFTFVILSHDRRRLVHFAVTANTAEWTARQLLQAFPWDHAPRYLLRDRDRAYGLEFSEMAKCMARGQNTRTA
jgi:putative transposase